MFNKIWYAVNLKNHQVKFVLLSWNNAKYFSVLIYYAHNYELCWHNWRKHKTGGGWGLIDFSVWLLLLPCTCMSTNLQVACIWFIGKLGK